MDSVLNFALLVFGLITVSVLGSLVMVFFLWWIAYASFNNALTDQSYLDLDINVTDEMQDADAIIQMSWPSDWYRKMKQNWNFAFMNSMSLCPFKTQFLNMNLFRTVLNDP